MLGELPDGLDPVHDPIVAALDRDDPRAALELIDAAATYLPSDVDLWWWRGHALRDLDRPGDAALSYEKAYALNPRLSITAQEAANALMDADEPRAAVAWAERAVAADPFDGYTRGVLAWAHYRSGDDAEAITVARDALDRDPIHHSARWLTALAHLRRGDVAAARTAADDASRVDGLLLRDPGPWLSAEHDALPEMARALVCHIDTPP